MDEQEHTGERRRRSVRRGGLVGPVILIAIGVVVLLNSLGIVEWSVWELIFRMWPVVIIAVGLDLLIGRRSVWGSLLALVLVVAVLAGGLWLFSLSPARWGAVEEFSQGLEGATKAEIVLEPAVGTLRVEALSEGDLLAAGAFRGSARDDAATDFSLAGERATFSVRSKSSGPWIWGGGPEWEVGLTPSVPLELEVSLGAAVSELNLTGLSLTDLTVSLGVGQTRVILPSEGDFGAQIETAVGQTTIIIPAGLAARIQMDAAMVVRQVPPGFQRQDDIYTSPGYASARNRVDLQVEQAIGVITIRQARGD